jgi:hypothetical protein
VIDRSERTLTRLPTSEEMAAVEKGLLAVMAVAGGGDGGCSHTGSAGVKLRTLPMVMRRLL